MNDHALGTGHTTRACSRRQACRSATMPTRQVKYPAWEKIHEGEGVMKGLDLTIDTSSSWVAVVALRQPRRRAKR